MPHISDSNYHKGMTLSLSLSPPVCLSTRNPFPPNKHFTCFTTFHLYMEIRLYTADGPGLCNWPLVPCGLVTRTQRSHCRDLTSIPGWELKPCLKPLQAEAIQHQADELWYP